jgi:uncharacterized protein (TIGR00251 family)
MKDLDRLDIRETEDGVVIRVKAVPASSRDKIVGVLGSALKIATSAPAEKHRANTAIAKILASALDLDAGRIELLSGSTGPQKVFKLTDLTEREVRNILRQRLG